MEIGVVGLAPAVLHAASAVGVSLGASVVTPSATAAAASTASAAMFSKLDFTSEPISPSSPTKPTDDNGTQSPAGISSLRRGSISEVSTPAATPGATSDAGDEIFPIQNAVSNSSFNSIRSNSSFDLSPSDRDAQIVDAKAVVRRLQAKPLTGQVVAWAWERAAALSLSKKAPPVSLLAALWPATETCAARCTAQDVVEILDAWLVLLQRWPRHFRLPADTLGIMASVTFPAAIKRMSDSRLQQLARACSGIAQHRIDPSLSNIGAAKTPSARDLMQPIFALGVAEAAWRIVDSVRYISPDVLELLITASKAWRWSATPIDSGLLLAMKESTQSALNIIKAAVQKEFSS
ncbi:hypothetical protein NADE_002819 [Nannochloris sp. 'desiccata']|nr:hypothetical protein NADE_002819 [Chlorella desiccata (nom. nud.)]